MNSFRVRIGTALGGRRLVAREIDREEMVVPAAGQGSRGYGHPLIASVSGENLESRAAEDGEREPPIQIEIDKLSLLRVGDLRRRTRKIKLPKLHRFFGGGQTTLDVMLLVV